MTEAGKSSPYIYMLKTGNFTPTKYILNFHLPSGIGSSESCLPSEKLQSRVLLNQGAGYLERWVKYLTLFYVGTNKIKTERSAIDQISSTFTCWAHQDENSRRECKQNRKTIFSLDIKIKYDMEFFHLPLDIAKKPIIRWNYNRSSIARYVPCISWQTKVQKSVFITFQTLVTPIERYYSGKS